MNGRFAMLAVAGILVPEILGNLGAGGKAAEVGGGQHKCHNATAHAQQCGVGHQARAKAPCTTLPHERLRTQQPADHLAHPR